MSLLVACMFGCDWTRVDPGIIKDKKVSYLWRIAILIFIEFLSRFINCHVNCRFGLVQKGSSILFLCQWHSCACWYIYYNSHDYNIVNTVVFSTFHDSRFMIWKYILGSSNIWNCNLCTWFSFNKRFK